MTKRQPTAEELFNAVVSLASEEQRAYLNAQCSDPDVRAEVEQLLAYDQAKGGGLTENPEGRSGFTEDFAQSRPGRGHRSLTDSSSSSIDHGRFLPGTVLSDRYRIVGLLGKGGMGEVYRADDLELGQSVALKFLPEEVSGEPRMLERFRGEVQISSTGIASECLPRL